MRFEKVVSGGQTGADIAGLKAAKDCGFLTSGFLPKGCITLEGPKPEYLVLYSMYECEEFGYPPRTERNVKYSDGTFRFATNYFSPGELCTKKFINKHNKPSLDFDMSNLTESTAVGAYQWILYNNIRVLNVAGNTEKTSPGIEKQVYDFLCSVFKKFKKGDNGV